MRLYQKFNLAYMFAYPYDYFAEIFCEVGTGKGNGFFPTPMAIVQMMAAMTMGQEIEEGKKAGIETRLLKFNDPCVGTGRMPLAASNYLLRAYVSDIDEMCCLATQVNYFLYAPWLARPLRFLDDLVVREEEKYGIEHSFDNLRRLFETSRRVLEPLSNLRG
jgi:hypothetical protein